MVLKKIRYVPALFKLYDQILINAAQNKQRDPTTSIIQVDIANTGWITITNNGKSVPIIEVAENVHLVQCIFGEKTTPQQHQRRGYNAKLVNIFSKAFYVQTGSEELKAALKVQWK